ncbi:MAG: helix-turn-helix domain-containing protein [Bacilli bacterium]|nr:helix-turn-helix domain-containing protein [Bacilli bacterium]
MKEWKHLTYEQRKVISSGIAHQKKAKHIAESLGVDPTTVSKEVKRNRNQITIGLNSPVCKKTLVKRFDKPLNVTTPPKKDITKNKDKDKKTTNNISIVVLLWINY